MMEMFETMLSVYFTNKQDVNVLNHHLCLHAIQLM